MNGLSLIQREDKAKHMILTIDIGGTNIKAGFCDYDGIFLDKKIYKTPSSCEELIQSILNLDYDYEGIAISIPGILNEDKSSVHTTGKLKYLSDYPIQKVLENEKQCKVTLENDARCATLAEVGFGNLKNSTNGLVVTIGTYLGMGLVIQNDLYSGSHGLAGEYGDALFLNHKKMAYTFGKEGLEEYVGYSGVELFQKLKDPGIFEKFDAYCTDLAKMLCNIQLLLDLDTILIGGGISSNPILIERIEKHMQDLKSNFTTMHMPSIQSCKYYNDANLLGALYVYKKRDH